MAACLTRKSTSRSIPSGRSGFAPVPPWRRSVAVAAAARGARWSIAKGLRGFESARWRLKWRLRSNSFCVRILRMSGTHICPHWQAARPANSIRQACERAAHLLRGFLERRHTRQTIQRRCRFWEPSSCDFRRPSTLEGQAVELCRPPMLRCLPPGYQ